ncbi:MAG: hypothetical protein ABI972_21595 [Acidobacteriota bacterium]
MRHRFLTIAAFGMLSMCAFGASSERGFQFMSASEASRELGAVIQTGSSAAMWVWTDKAIYNPGDPLTVRWTVKPNNDFYPYTIVAYRQNNQTGAKSYLPNNNSTATDIFGNSVDQGFRITRLPSANKAIIVGAGGSVVSSTLTVPNELGMHTIVVQLRDYSGGRVLKAAYWKIGVVSGFADLPSNITADTKLTNDRAWRIRGIVTVLNNATLTIDPGTFIVGQPGSQPPSVLLISTAGKLVAEGTQSRPIIMTSSQPIGSRQRGDWGGLILLGKAQVNDVAGKLNIEGLPDLPETLYGGTDNAHSCGSMKYVRVEFAGSLLRPNEETNSFTFGACGTGTKAEYLQAIYGLDDSFEWFGGTMNAKHLVGAYGADDYFDGQIGYSGKIQFGVALVNGDLSNRGIEMDNYEKDFTAKPQGMPNFWNITFIGNAGDGFDESDAPCLYFRRGAGGSYNNLLCYNWSTRGLGGANIDSIQPNIDSGAFNMNGILLWDNGKNTSPAAANTLAGQVLSTLSAFGTAARNFYVADPMLARPLELNDPDLRPAPNSPVFRANYLQPPDDGFFDQSATYVGAFDQVNWMEEWTQLVQEQDLKP